MKSSSIIRSGLMFLMLLAAVQRPVLGQALYWDPSTTAAVGSGTGTTLIGANGLQGTPAAGTWNTSAFWTTVPTSVNAGDYTTYAGGTPDVIFNVSPAAVNVVPGPVTINANESVNSLTISGGRWSFNGTGTLTIGAGGLALSLTPPTGVSYVNNSGAVVPSSPGLSNLPATLGASYTVATNNIVLSTSQTWSNFAFNNSNNMTFSGTITGSAAAPTTLTLTSGSAGSGFTFSNALIDGAGGSLSLLINNVTTNNNFTLTSAASTFTGSTTIQNGSLLVSSLANAGSNSSLGVGAGVGNGGTGSSLINMGLTGTGNNTTLQYTGNTAASTDRVINSVDTLAGTTTVSSSGSGALTLSGATPFTFNGSGTGKQTIALGGTSTAANTVSGVISDAPGKTALSKTGTGLWVLNGANTFSGGVTVSGGTLSLGAAATLGSNIAGNAITIAGGNLLLGADTNIGNNQTITLNNVAGNGIGVNYTPTAFPNLVNNSGANAVIFGLNYTGTGGIGTVAGINNLFTASTSTFLGAFTGAGTYTGASLQVGAGNNYRLGGGGGTITIQNAILSGTGNNLLVGGATGGTVILSATGNTFDGTVALQNGNLVIAGGSSLGVGASAINIGSTTNAVGLNYAGIGETISRTLNFAGTTGAVTLSNSGTGNVIYSAAPTWTAGARAIVLGAATDAFGGRIGTVTTAPSALVAANVASVTKNGLGNSTWVLTGGDTYTGNTVIAGGVLSVPGGDLANSFINLNALDASHYAVLQTSGTISRTLSGTAASTNLNWGSNGGFAAKGGNLTLNFSGGAAQFWGMGNFMGQGTAAMVFGSTTSDSQVILQNGFDFGQSGANLSTGFNRGIDVEGAAATIVGGTANNGVSGSSALISGVIAANVPTATAGAFGDSGNNGFIKTGSGTLILTGANTYSGATTVNGGTLIAGGNSALGTPGVFGDGHSMTPTGGGTTVAGSQSITLGGANFNSGDGADGTAATGASPTLLIGGAYTVALPVTIANIITTGTYGIGGSTDTNSTLSGLVTANQSFSVTQVANTGGNGSFNMTGGVSGANATIKTVTFNNAGAVNVTTNGISDGVGGGKVAVTQQGPGTTTLAALNTYTGATTVNGGVLVVSGITVSGSAVTINAGTLNVTGSVAGTVSIGNGGTLTGNGTVGTTTVGTGGRISLLDGSIGTLNIGGLTTGGSTSSAFSFDLGSVLGSNDMINSTGILTLGGVTSITLGNATGVSTLTDGLYDLITYGGTFTGSLSNFNLLTTSLDGQTLSLVQGASSIQLLISSGGGAPTIAYFTGSSSTDMTSASNYVSSPTGGAVSGAPDATTDVYVTANTGTTGANALAPNTNTGALSVKGLFFTGTGTPNTTGATISGSNTLTTGSDGITVQTGAGNDTISAPVALGAAQTWTVTDASNTLTVSGAVSGTGNPLTTAGAGSVVLSGNNTYSGGTIISSGSLYANNATSSTGTGSVTVNSGGILRGIGTIAPTGGNGISVLNGGILAPGSGQITPFAGTPGTVATGNLTVANAAPVSLAAGAGLTFALGAGNSSSALVVGTSIVTFNSNVVTINDLVGAGLTLNHSYTLIDGTSMGQYQNLTTTGILTANGYLITSGLSLLSSTPGTNFFADWYGTSQLYLTAGGDINVDVVPEPGTWALMIGGLALLVFVQRRKRRMN